LLFLLGGWRPAGVTFVSLRLSVDTGISRPLPFNPVPG
jgi:hypothetical protein